MAISKSTNTASESNGSADAQAPVTLTGIQLALQPGESGITHGEVTWDLYGHINDGSDANGGAGNDYFMHQQWVTTYDLVPGQVPEWNYDPVESLTINDFPPADGVINNFDIYMQYFALTGPNSDTLSITMVGPAIGNGLSDGSTVTTTYHVDWKLTSSEWHLVLS